MTRWRARPGGGPREAQRRARGRLAVTARVRRRPARSGGDREVRRRPGRSGDGRGGLATAGEDRRLPAGSGDPRGPATRPVRRWQESGRQGPAKTACPAARGTDAGAAPTTSSGSTGNIEPSRTGDLPLSPTVDLPPVPVQGAKGDSRPRPGSTRQPRRGERWARCWPFARVYDHRRAAAALIQGARLRRPARSPAAGVVGAAVMHGRGQPSRRGGCARCPPGHAVYDH